MSGFSIEQLKFDPTATEDTHNVGAYVRASDGTLVTHTTDGSKQRLDVNTGVEYATGDAAAADARGSYALAVDAAGNFAPLRVNADGELLVDVQINSGADKAEDTASASGDIGSYVLSVRQNTLTASTDADGDFQSFKTDALGALWVNSYKTAPQSGHNAAASAQTAVTNVATPIPAANLTNRTKMVIQNKSTNAPVTLGFTNSVVFGTGPNLSPGSSVELEVGPGVTVYGITSGVGVTANISSMELGYNP